MHSLKFYNLKVVRINLLSKFFFFNNYEIPNFESVRLYLIFLLTNLDFYENIFQGIIFLESISNIKTVIKNIKTIFH
jgi:hypothetical protein